MTKRTADQMAEYQRARRAKIRTVETVEDAVKADVRADDLIEEVQRLKKELSASRLSQKDPVDKIATEVAAASAAKKAIKVLRERSANDYRAEIQSMTQDQRDLIIKMMPSTKRGA